MPPARSCGPQEQVDADVGGYQVSELPHLQLEGRLQHGRGRHGPDGAPIGLLRIHALSSIEPTHVSCEFASLQRGLALGNCLTGVREARTAVLGETLEHLEHLRLRLLRRPAHGLPPHGIHRRGARPTPMAEENLAHADLAARLLRPLPLGGRPARRRRGLQRGAQAQAGAHELSGGAALPGSSQEGDTRSARPAQDELRHSSCSGINLLKLCVSCGQRHT
mmetsp:Transcript_91487/g.272998  ORF Transcript_91487/g.272998 Transcript_91487/m.272998 type:complete len:221 (-) Transcript_91487:394-1056(-)